MITTFASASDFDATAAQTAGGWRPCGLYLVGTTASAATASLRGAVKRHRYLVTDGMPTVIGAGGELQPGTSARGSIT